MPTDREHLDNQLEDYFFQLVLLKDVTITTLETLRDVWTRDPSTGLTLSWFTDADKIAIGEMVFGPNSIDIHTRIKRGVLVSMETARTSDIFDLGSVFFLILQIFESLINVPDADALRFIMNQRKEDVEVMLLSHIRTILEEYRGLISRLLAEQRASFERRSDATLHTEELARVRRGLQEITEKCIVQYSTDSEIEGAIEGFVRESAMFAKRF